MAENAEDILKELIEEFNAAGDFGAYPHMNLETLPEWKILCLTHVFLFLIQVFLF